MSDPWQQLCDRWGADGYRTLSKPEQVWLNSRAFIDAVENGGVISYFFNPWPGSLADTLQALDELGAGGIRRQVERVCALFPEGVPADLDARNEIIGSWPSGDSGIDDLLEDVDSRLMVLMSTLEERLSGYVESHGLAP